MTSPKVEIATAIRIVLVDDSPTALAALHQLIESSPGFEVVSALSDPRRVLETVETLRPDLVVLDFDMPGLDGAGVTEQVMRHCPTPILIVTGLQREREREMARFRALKAGAVDMVSKEGLAGAATHDAVRRVFLRKLRVVAGVTVARRWRGAADPSETQASPLVRPSGSIRLVAIAASTGGPPALERVLTALGPDLKVPVVVVQHLSSEFFDSFVGWLGQATGRRLVKARDGEELVAGTIYLAPDGSHLTVTRELRVALDGTVAVNGCRPSADRLFGSVASVLGKEALGVLLTGMGRDGASGLKLMRDAGAVTLVQDEETSVVFGMPGEAVKLGAQSMILPIDEIGPALRGLLQGAGRKEETTQ